MFPNSFINGPDKPNRHVKFCSARAARTSLSMTCHLQALLVSRFAAVRRHFRPAPILSNYGTAQSDKIQMFMEILLVQPNQLLQLKFASPTHTHTHPAPGSHLFVAHINCPKIARFSRFEATEFCRNFHSATDMRNCEVFHFCRAT